jgi:hypothetical protein
MTKEMVIVVGVMFGSFLIAHHFLKPKAPKMAEKMSNASGCGCGGSSNFGGCCGA